MAFRTLATSLKALQRVAQDSLDMSQASKVCLLVANGVCTTCRWIRLSCRLLILLNFGWRRFLRPRWLAATYFLIVRWSRRRSLAISNVVDPFDNSLVTDSFSCTDKSDFLLMLLQTWHLHNNFKQFANTLCVHCTYTPTQTHEMTWSCLNYLSYTPRGHYKQLLCISELQQSFM